MYPNNLCYEENKTFSRSKCQFHRKASTQHVCKDFLSSLILDETGKYRKPVGFHTARIVIA